MDWAAAEAAHRRALLLARLVFGAGSTQAAAACHGLALVCRYIGAFEEAERLYRDALAVATTGGDDRFAATICHNLGGLHTPGSAVRR